MSDAQLFSQAYVSLSVCMFDHLSLCVYVCGFGCVSERPFVRPSVRPFVFLSV